MKSAGMGAAALGLPHVSCTAEPRKEKPNIVYVLADDLGYGDPGCYNEDSKMPTPAMDGLAQEGVRFTDAHSPSAVCCPTRYGILTGRYSWRTSLKWENLEGYDPCLIDPGRMTVASLLKKNGYRTGCIGKWHLGLGSEKPTDYSKAFHPGPVDLGFDYFFGIPASMDMPPYVYLENDRVTEAPSMTIEASESPRNWRRGAIAPGFRHIDVLPTMTKKAVEFIGKNTIAAPDEPFFLYFPMTAPHRPWLPTEGFEGRSRAGLYGDFVTQVDWSLSEILTALARRNLSRKTLVVFTSDNGARSKVIPAKYHHLANYYYRGQKSDIWDGGHRIPFIARWPGKIGPGTTSSEIICLTDLLATCAAVVGDTLPDNAGEDSYNILPALRGERLDTPIREATVHHSILGMFSIRQGPWKLVLGQGGGGFGSSEKWERYIFNPETMTGQLYNVEEDFSEKKNLYRERPDVVKRLTALLEKYKIEGRSRPVSGTRSS